MPALPEPGDYRVVWIVPLEIQVRAALHLLDVRYDSKLSVRGSDKYVLHAGRMSNHNIIIATLATHQEYWAMSVVKLAEEVRKLFPNILYVLLLGVSVGQPQNPVYDIRLGDVLVDVPDRHNFETSDRDYEEGERTLSKTKAILRAATDGIKLKALNDAAVFLPFYEAICGNENATGIFNDPGQDLDKLHLDSLSVAEEEVSRTRQPAAPRTRVWYGLADLKETPMFTQQRNDLGDGYNSFNSEINRSLSPWVAFGVIQGVYAYDDRHKNNVWQPYAAAMAAAFAKAVLTAIPSLYQFEDNMNREPLIWAASKGHKEIVNLLLGLEKQDINARDAFGQTPLLLAAANGHQEVVKLLLATTGVDINSKDHFGKTPFLRAAAKGHEAIVNILLASPGVDIDSSDNSGHTPLSYAILDKNKAIEKLITDRQTTKPKKPVLSPERTPTPARTDTEDLPERTPASLTELRPIQQQTAHSGEPIDGETPQIQSGYQHASEQQIAAVSPDQNSLGGQAQEPSLTSIVYDGDDDSCSVLANPLPTAPRIPCFPPAASHLIMPSDPEIVVELMPGPRLEAQTGHPQPRRDNEASLRQQRAQPIPPGFIQRLDDQHFSVKTRNRCNDVFMETIQASTEEEAEMFFRAVDRYDKLRGPARKFRSRLLDLYLTFAPLAKPSGTPVVIPEEDLELDALDVTLSGTARQDSTPAARPDVAPATPAPVPPDGGAAPQCEGDQLPPNSTHKVFICVALGRPDRWKLNYVEFQGHNDKPYYISNKKIFNGVRATLGEYQKSRGLLRFIFPLRVSRVGYYEFNVYNTVLNSVRLGDQNKLPSDHQPHNEWKNLCPPHKWYFIEPMGEERREIREGLAGPVLTDAVCNPHEFDGQPILFRYRAYLPWKLRVRFNEDGFPDGWGLVVRFEFNFFVFWCVWGTVSLLLSLALLLGLYVAANSPAHGQPSIAIAAFLAPFGVLGTVFGGAYAYAKQNKYLD